MLVLGCTFTIYTGIPPILQFTQKLKTGILNVALGWAFQFLPVIERDDERDKKLEFSRLGFVW